MLFRKLRYARTSTTRKGVTSIEIPLHPTENPKSCTEWQQIDVPSEVLEHIQQRNRDHFGQAHGTPFTIPPLSEHLGFTGYSEYGQQMLDGTYDATELDSNVQLLIQHLEHTHEMELDESRPSISAEEFRGKLQVWTESTSTSPSGMHLGHYKSLIAKHSFSSDRSDDELTPEYCIQRDELNIKQADLFALHLALINYALERGTTYKRWQTIANSIIFKDPDTIKLHRIRVIHIYEADYNLALGIKWRTATQHAEATDLLNMGQYGSRTGRRATDPVLIEEMQYEISRATRKPLLLTHYDATACYDRIIPNLGMIVSRKFGVPAEVTRMNATTLEQATYLVRTELGLSPTGYNHCEDEPIYGTGQGSSNSPAIWLFISSALMDAYEEWAESAKYSTPTEDCQVNVNMIGFVDDNTGQNNDFFGEPNRANIDAIVDQAMGNAQSWFDLLGASGGSLEYSKCCIHMLDWRFSKTGSPFLGMYDDELQQRLAVHNTATGASQRITLLSAYKAHKTLGHYKEPAGSQQEQFRQLKKLSDESTAFLWKCPLTRHEAWTYYFACYLPSIGYTLPCSSLTRNKLEEVQKKALPIMVARCGFNRNTHRAILYGPMEYGGASFRHLYIQQGYGQVTEFIRNWRLKSTAGLLMRIALAWFQEQVGVSFSIMSNVKASLPHLESKWLASLREFLGEYDMSLVVTTPGIPKLQRMYDVHLMDIILNSKQFKNSEIRQLNYCRLFLKAITLSDITHTTGTRLDGSKLNGDPSLYSSTRIGNSIHQERPSEKEWKLWRRAAKLWSDDNGNLHEPLGPWILHPKEQRMRHRSYVQADGRVGDDVYLWIQIGSQYVQCIMTTDQWHFQESLFTCSWEDLPDDLFPVEAWPRPGNQWRLTYCGNRLIPRPQSCAGTFKEFILELAPWESELLRMTDVSEDIFSTGLAISHGLRAVSDGSVWEETNGAFGWALSTDQGERVAKGMGPARGVKIDSYRAEAYGMLSLLCFLKRLAEFLGQNDEWQGIVATDSQSLLDTILDGPYVDKQTDAPIPSRLKDIKYLNVMDPDWDITSNIIAVATDIPGIRFQYVRGHQDRTTSYDRLPLLAQLNVDADEMANKYQRDHGKPRTTVLPTDTSGVYLHTTDGSITKQVGVTVRYQATAPALIHHIRHRYQWSEHEFHSVNWPAHGSALRGRMEKRTHLIKLVHGILPTGKHLYRKDNTRNVCVACKTDVEDWPHILRCSHSPRQKWRDGVIRAVTSKCEKLDTRPALQRVLLAGISGWFASTNNAFTLDPAEFHIEMNKVILNQNQLGWNQVFLGRFCWDWSDLQDTYYAVQRAKGKKNRHTGQRWQTAIIGELWTQWTTVWSIRNNDVHGSDATARQQAITREVRRDLRSIYDTRSHMEPSSQALLFDTLEEHMTQPTWVIKNWMAIHVPGIKSSIRRARLRAITGVRSLQQYFGPR